ncbi:MAG: hypothetical protein VB060_11385, partial [Oscillibacter sp.]
KKFYIVKLNIKFRHIALPQYCLLHFIIIGSLSANLQLSDELLIHNLHLPLPAYTKSIPIPIKKALG